MSAETAASLQPDGIDPELGDIVVTLHVYVERFIPISGIEEEPVGPEPKYGRHGITPDRT